MVFIRGGELVSPARRRVELHSGDSGGSPDIVRFLGSECETQNRTREYGSAGTDDHRLDLHRGAIPAP